MKTKKIILSFTLTSLIPLSTICLIQCEEKNDFQIINKNEINNKTKTNDEIYLLNEENKIIINKKDYYISNFFQEQKATEVKLVVVNDGDTAFLENIKNNNEKSKFRFFGIDTPETSKKINNIFEPTNGIQYKYGKIAKNFTSDKLKNAKKIWVIPQTTKSIKNKEKNKYFYDKFNRIVAIIIVLNKDGKFICLNKELVINGYSKVAYISLDKKNLFYSNNDNFYHYIKNAEKEAREKEIGIWKEDLRNIYPKD
ncbi:thermonuclease family protein [Metamycoplasma canadense]|uniref:TNase-like domain-containing protein n=1 Tax=Metamycoplasma canadense TaxID=29554 RepID=A0A077L762_9BACT|nr:thermonuclease family protein [Metamycoplasma canadense]BAP39641.1 hypothetical protein MCAN360_0524 [Metamycoplasma canadense]